MIEVEKGGCKMTIVRCSKCGKIVDALHLHCSCCECEALSELLCNEQMRESFEEYREYREEELC